MVILLGGSSAFIPTFENAAYGIEWTKNDNDIIRIGNAKFHRELPIQNRLNGPGAGSGYFSSNWVRSDSHATVGFFTAVKLD